MEEYKRTKTINVVNALEMLETEMNVGFKVAREKHSDLMDVKNDIETKLFFLYELNCIRKKELDSMLSALNEKYETERSKR